MFQPWFVEIMQVISNVAVTITSIIVAIVAVIGLSQWQRELKGKARFDVIKRLTYSAYEFRDQYNRARSMWTDGSESYSRLKNNDETKKETLYRNEYFARSQRILPLQKTLRDMYQSSWEGEILFEDIEIGKLIKPFEKAFKDLNIAIGTYFSRYIERSMKDAEVPSEDKAWLKEDHEVIYGHHDDKHSKHIDKVLEDFISELKPLV